MSRVNVTAISREIILREKYSDCSRESPRKLWWRIGSEIRGGGGWGGGERRRRLRRQCSFFRTSPKTMEQPLFYFLEFSSLPFHHCVSSHIVATHLRISPTSRGRRRDRPTENPHSNEEMNFPRHNLYTTGPKNQKRLKNIYPKSHCKYFKQGTWRTETITLSYM